MWQAPNQRVGAIQSSKKRLLERLSRPIHLRRVRAEVRLVPPNEVQGQAETTNAEGEVREARVVLNDLSFKGIGLYAPEPMVSGQSVTVTLDDPAPITIKGKVVWCKEENTSGKVLSQQPYHFRVGIKFVFSSPEEEEKLKQFCEDLQKNHLYKPKTPPQE